MGVQCSREEHQDVEKESARDPLSDPFMDGSRLRFLRRARKRYKRLRSLFSDDGGDGNSCVRSTEGKKDLAVVCSDQVGGRWHTKPEFYAYVKEHFGDRYNISFLNSASKKINYLVWAGADGSPARYTSKVQKVEGYNAKGSNIPIVTGEQFVKLLEDGQV